MFFRILCRQWDVRALAAGLTEGAWWNTNPSRSMSASCVCHVSLGSTVAAGNAINVPMMTPPRWEGGGARFVFKKKKRKHILTQCIIFHYSASWSTFMWWSLDTHHSCGPSAANLLMQWDDIWLTLHHFTTCLNLSHPIDVLKKFYNHEIKDNLSLWKKHLVDSLSHWYIWIVITTWVSKAVRLHLLSLIISQLYSIHTRCAHLLRSS